MCAKLAVHVYGNDSNVYSSLNNIAHSYRFDKFRVFEQMLIRHLSPVEASGLEMLRAGTIRDFVRWRNELRHSIGNLVIRESNLDKIFFIISEYVIRNAIRIMYSAMLMIICNNTSTGLQKQIDVANAHICKYGLSFKPTKTECVFFGKCTLENTCTLEITMVP